MTENRVPTTEAGRALLAVLPDIAGVNDPEWLADYSRTIVAIEDQARSEQPAPSLDVLRRVLNSSHGANLGSGSNYRQCQCPVHAEAFRLVARDD